MKHKKLILKLIKQYEKIENKTDQQKEILEGLKKLVK